MVKYQKAQKLVNIFLIKIHGLILLMMMWYRFFSMDVLDQLAKKVQLAANDLISLKKEKQQLVSELELLRHELRHHQSILRENEKLRRHQYLLRAKLEKIHHKLGKYTGTNAQLTYVLEGGNREEHSQ